MQLKRLLPNPKDKKAKENGKMKKFAVDFMNKEIVVSAKYLRQSSVVDSSEYKMMLHLTKELPNFKVVVRQTARPMCRRFQPTYMQMEEIIRLKAEDPRAALEEFLRVCEHSREIGSGYHHVLHWFMSKYYDAEEIRMAA